MNVLHINSTEEFNEKVIRSDDVVLVDFWADWCGPCKMLAPVLDQVAKLFDGKAVVAKVNVDDHQSLAMEYQVMSIPALFVFKNGAVVNQSVGVQPIQAIQKMVEEAL